MAPSLAELREKYLERGRPVPRAVLSELEADSRSGAQALLKAIKTRKAARRSEGQRLRHMLKFETELYEQGYTVIAGVDEAGMAPLAGPVVAGAAILPKGYKLEGLKVTPDFVLVDARKIPHIAHPQRGIIKGDALSLSIAAGAMIAKTTRDAHMATLDVKYPGWGFASHKGYPTPEHLDAIDRLGVCEIHRRSFAPVKKALGLLPEQDELFEVEEVEARVAGGRS